MKLTAVLAVVTVGVLGVGSPALAVGTDTFSLAAEGSRAGIVYDAGAGALEDAVRVGNRTDEPLVIELDAVGVTRLEDGTLAYGGSGAGLAASVELAERRVTLAPNEERLVKVAITPSDAGDWAAITATVAPSASAGLEVRSRLAVIIKQEGSVPRTALHVAIVIATLLILSTVYALSRTRRRGEPQPA